jgi:hypothetical protein
LISGLAPAEKARSRSSDTFTSWLREFERQNRIPGPRNPHDRLGRV